MKIEITAITIVESKHGPDYLFLNTNLPASQFPFEGTETVTMIVAQGKAKEYVKLNFPDIVPKIVEKASELSLIRVS